MIVTAIGWRAHAALGAGGGRVDVIAPLSSSFYGEAAGELVWVGPPGAPLHPRTVIASGAPVPVSRAAVRLDSGGVAPWRPSSLDERCLSDAEPALHATLASLGQPRGLGRLLASGGDDDLVTARARPHARALAAACAGDDPSGVVEAARPLLGLGDGLTPSGDDFVGGAMFARRLIARRNIDAWSAAVAQIVTDAAALTHPISARLLADLAVGEGWAPLHELTVALAAHDHGAAVTAARALTVLGHTSGWDLLAGYCAALGLLAYL